MKTLVIATIVAILFVPSLSPAYKQVRDGSGNLIREESGDFDRLRIRESTYLFYLNE